MIRGIQKNMIQIQTQDSKYFDYACFVMKTNLPKPSANENEMLREAQKILRQTLPKEPKKIGAMFGKRLFCLGWGILFGASGMGLLGLWSILA